MTELFKVIHIDNYGCETRPESLVQENMLYQDALDLCEKLQKDPNSDWYVVREQSYKLHRGMEDII